MTELPDKQIDRCCAWWWSESCNNQPTEWFEWISSKTLIAFCAEHAKTSVSKHYVGNGVTSLTETEAKMRMALG